MFEKYRIRTASKFGRIEHRYGRIIVLPIIISILWNYEHNDYINFGISIITLLFWCTYITSHTLEKKFYGNLGTRSKKS